MDKPKLNCIVRWIIFPVVVVILFILMVVFLLLESYVAPVLKGFHCNDITISYAYYSHQTVPTWALFVIVLAVSPFVILVLYILKFICEFFFKQSLLSCSCKTVCYYILNPLNTLGWYIIGLSLTSIITSIIKISYGELRPHFIAACNPNFTEINCNDNFGSPQYVSDAECQGSASVVMEARNRMKFASIQAALFMIIGILFPALIGVTRINDFYHHPHDVIFGLILGYIIATIIVYYYLKKFHDTFDHIKETPHAELIEQPDAVPIVNAEEADSAI